MENREIKLPEEEMLVINELRNNIRENVDMVGNIIIKKHFLEFEIKILQDTLVETLLKTEELNKFEKIKVDEIVAKYGEGKLDFLTGIYTQN